MQPCSITSGQKREAELRAAASLLKLHDVCLLDYVDGDLDQADPATITAQLAAHLRRIRPQVVVTFGPDGAYGHPDHIAISQFTTAAALSAADSAYRPDLGAAHRLCKLYYLADTKELFDLYASCAGSSKLPGTFLSRRWPCTTRRMRMQRGSMRYITRYL